MLHVLSISLIRRRACSLILVLGSVAVLLTAGCGGSTPSESINESQNPAVDTSEASELEGLMDWMTGTFDSSAQAGDDPAYYGVQLQMCPVQAPELGEHILYVEQAMMSDLNSPYRQRLYRLTQNAEGEYVSEVYALNGTQALVGLCNQDTSGKVFEPSDYELKDGCAVYLEKAGNYFVGGTRGKGCDSLINGASYATSEVSVFENSIESWDRGFTNQDNQVWGATDGAYVFVRQAADSGNIDTDDVDTQGNTGSTDDSGSTMAVAGETCQDAPQLATKSTLRQDASSYTHTVTAPFGQSNDYNPHIESGLAPGCSPVYDSMGKDVVFQVTLAPGDTLYTRLTLPQNHVAGIYMLDDCDALTWPDVDESGMCGRPEYSSQGYCGYGCEPLEWSFAWPTAIGGVATGTKTFFLVIDEVIGNSAADFTLDWSIVAGD